MSRFGNEAAGRRPTLYERLSFGARDGCPRVARGCAGVLHPVAGVVPEDRDDDGWRVLLPGGLAARAVGARLREYPETRIRVRAHGGIRLGVHGTTGGAFRLRVARARGSSGRGPGAEGRPLHAFRNASRVAHASAPGNVDDRCARPADESRVTRARHLELAGLPSICRANRDRAWQAIRTQSERVGLADRQRTEPLRPLVFVRTGEPGEVSRLAPRPVQDDRCAEHRVGKCLLVADVQRLLADRHPESRRARRGGERACAARLPAVVRGRSGRLHSVPGGSAAPPHVRSVDHVELHAHAPGGVSAALGEGPRHHHVDDLSRARQPERRPAGVPPGRRHRDVVHGGFRPVDQRSPRRDGAAARAGELGRRQSTAVSGRRPQLDPAGVRARRTGALHLPLPAAARRQRAVPRAGSSAPTV